MYPNNEIIDMIWMIDLSPFSAISRWDVNYLLV